MAGQIRDHMTERVVSVRYHDSIATAVDRLTRFGFSALPVVTDTGRLVGVVSLLDVLRYREAHAAEGERADESAPVEEIMNPDVVSMQATANVAAVANRLREAGQLRVMPIVRGGRLIGVVTRGDLLRERRDRGRGGLRRWLGLRVRGRRRDRADEDALFALARQRHRGPTPEAGTPVDDVMTRSVITAAPTDMMIIAEELMVRHRHTALPVVTGDDLLVGIVSEADVLAALNPGLGVAGTTVGQVMTREPTVVRTGTTVGAARTLVADRGLRTVPVVDGDRLVGVLSRSDLL